MTIVVVGLWPGDPYIWPLGFANSEMCGIKPRSYSKYWDKCRIKYHPLFQIRTDRLSGSLNNLQSSQNLLTIKKLDYHHQDHLSHQGPSSLWGGGIYDDTEVLDGLLLGWVTYLCCSVFYYIDQSSTQTRCSEVHYALLRDVQGKAGREKK